MKKLVLFLLLFIGISQAQYGARFLQSYEYIIAPASDSTITFDKAWYNVVFFSDDDSTKVKFGDAQTILANEPEVPWVAGRVISFGEKTQLKKLYLENESAVDSAKFYLVGDKNTIRQ